MTTKTIAKKTKTVVISGKVRNLGHQKGWNAVKSNAMQLFVFYTPLELPLMWLYEFDGSRLELFK